jgi:hypothetical protein
VPITFSLRHYNAAVRIERANASTLIGTPLGRTSLLRFHQIHGASFTTPP